MNSLFQKLAEYYKSVLLALYAIRSSIYQYSETDFRYVGSSKLGHTRLFGLLTKVESFLLPFVDTHLLSNASLLKKVYEIASLTSLIQKCDEFFAVPSTNCQTGEKNV